MRGKLWLAQKQVMHMEDRTPDFSTVPPLEENLKKAVTEMLVLYLLSQREYYIGELTEQIRIASHQALNVVFPYAAIYRMETAGYIEERKKRRAPDGRWRQYYGITETGRQRLAVQLGMYRRVVRGVEDILGSGDDQA